MRTIASILLLAWCVAAHADDSPRAYTGRISEISREDIFLDDSLMVGFVGPPAVLRELDAFKKGDRVLVVFGSVPNPEGHGRINELLSIRRCKRVDAECAAARAQADAEEKVRAKESAIFLEGERRCDLAMRGSLASDARHVPPREPDVENPGVISRFNALAGEQKACAHKVVRAHVVAMREACELHHCGDNIGGGCSHIAGYSENFHLYEVAVAKCGEQETERR